MENSLLVNTTGSPSLLRTIADNLSDPVIFLDENFEIIFVNRRFAGLTGYDPAELTGKPVTHLVGQNDPGWSFPAIHSSISGNDRWKGRLLLAKRDGGYVKTDASIWLEQADSSENGRIYFLLLDPSTASPKQPASPGRINWQSVLHKTTNGLFVVDANCQILFLNEKAEWILRHHANWVDEHLSKNLLDFLPPDRKKPFEQIISHVLQGHDARYEVEYKKPGKESVWLWVNCRPLRDENDELNQVCITSYDITAYKQKEAALIKSEQRWKFALDGAGDGVWEYNFQTRESYYSPLYKQMLGFTEEEFPNEAYEWHSRVHPDDFFRIVNIDDLYEKGLIENHAVEYRLRSKRGDYVWVLDRGMLLERTADGKPLRLIGTHKNISEEKEAEERLKKSERIFSSFMSNTPTMTWIIDEHNIIRYLNPSYRHAFKLTEDVIGKSAHEVFPRIICDRFVENNWKVWERNMAIEITEEGVGPEGQRQIYQIYKFPLDPENGVKMLGGVALDITKNVELEQKLASDEAQRKKEIIQAIINAQEKERKEISYELHDNVNQILTSSKLMLEVAVDKPELSQEFTHRCLDYLKEAIAEIRKISHHLTPAALRDISLDAAVESVVENINATGRVKVEYYNSLAQLEKNIQPEKQLALLRIIQEQFNNILKHAGATAVTISLFMTDAGIGLEIQDNGCGFDPETTKRGLGLNNMFNRVEYYDGTIELTSAMGRGCTLYIELPM
jgi:PAS domain S-box-containing protein